MEKGTYVYDAAAHNLKPVVVGDFRALTGKQEFVKQAPMTIVFVADLTRMGSGPPKRRNRSPIAMPPSSARTCICSALRKDWRPAFGPTSTNPPWPRP